MKLLHPGVLVPLMREFETALRSINTFLDLSRYAQVESSNSIVCNATPGGQMKVWRKCFNWLVKYASFIDFFFLRCHGLLSNYADM